LTQINAELNEIGQSINTMFIKWSLCPIALMLAAPLFADTLYGGLEDYAGNQGYEKWGDFNDMVYSLSGDISVNAPSAQFNDLTPSMVNENGSLYFDQHSLDGSDYNIGYCVLDLGSCHLPVALGAMRYLATASGAAPLGITFHANGPVSFSLLLQVTSGTDTLGWYDPANPGDLHFLFNGPGSTGATVTINMNGDFVLFSQNSLGQFYSSIAAANLNESVSQQHFALFEDPPPATAAEPATMFLVGLTLITGAWLVRRASQPAVDLRALPVQSSGITAQKKSVASTFDGNSVVSSIHP
jgi:hypothetical protein